MFKIFILYDVDLLSLKFILPHSIVNYLGCILGDITQAQSSPE